MRVFVLGGTGSIGTAILTTLCANNNDVTALCRSDTAAKRVRKIRARPVLGDLRAPDHWVDEAARHDAVIQVAATFNGDMGDVDAQAISALIEAASNRDAPLRVLYTGGCWLYGEAGDDVATEDHPFDPLPAFAWMVDHARRLLHADGISAAIVHPAVVYHEVGGVFERFLTAARAGQPVEIWGSANTRWPLIHRDDLAQAYWTLLRRPDLVGHFNAVAEEGVPVGQIVATLCAEVGNTHDPRVLPVSQVVTQHGDWARGPTLDQRMSATKLRTLTDWRPQKRDYRMTSILV